MNILEQLFCGMLHPLEDESIVTNSDYKKAMDEACQVSKELQNILSSEQMRLFYLLSEKVGAVQYAVAKQHFVNGFILGSKIMLEIYKNNEETA